MEEWLYANIIDPVDREIGSKEVKQNKIMRPLSR